MKEPAPIKPGVLGRLRSNQLLGCHIVIRATKLLVKWLCARLMRRWPAQRCSFGDCPSLREVCSNSNVLIILECAHEICLLRDTRLNDEWLGFATNWNADVPCSSLLRYVPRSFGRFSRSTAGEAQSNPVNTWLDTGGIFSDCSVAYWSMPWRWRIMSELMVCHWTRYCKMRAIIVTT